MTASCRRRASTWPSWTCSGLRARRRRPQQVRSGRGGSAGCGHCARSRPCLLGTGLEGCRDRSGLGGDRRRPRRACGPARRSAGETPRDRPKDGRFRLAVDRSFTLAGLGTAVTGTVLSGRVRARRPVSGQPVGPGGAGALDQRAEPAGRAGEAGQRCALVLSGPQISKEAVRRGDVVLDPALHAPTARIDASLRVLPSRATARSASGFRSRCTMPPPRCRAASWCCAMRRSLPARREYVQLVLERPLAAAVRRPLRHSRHLLEPHRRRRHLHRFARTRAAAAHARAPRARSRPWRERDPAAALASALAGPGALDRPRRLLSATARIGAADGGAHPVGALRS